MKQLLILYSVLPETTALCIVYRSARSSRLSPLSLPPPRLFSYIFLVILFFLHRVVSYAIPEMTGELSPAEEATVERLDALRSPVDGSKLFPTDRQHKTRNEREIERISLWCVPDVRCG